MADRGVRRAEATIEEARAADAVILLRDHTVFDLDALASSARYFLDTRHCTAGPTVEYL